MYIFTCTSRLPRTGGRLREEPPKTDCIIVVPCNYDDRGRMFAKSVRRKWKIATGLSPYAFLLKSRRCDATGQSPLRHRFTM